MLQDKQEVIRFLEQGANPQVRLVGCDGEEVIDLGTPKSGDVVQGVCSMGMYSFQIKVS